MSTFFQVNISPVTRPVQKTVPTKKESEEVSILSLAPFSSNPKLFFEDIKVGETATRQLIIRNPSKQDVQLYISRSPPPEREVTLDFGNGCVPSNGEIIVEIIWCPSSEGAWRDFYTFEDGCRIKKDIPIVFKSISTKKVKKVTKSVKMKRPTYVSKKVRSPVKKMSPRSAPKRTSPKLQTVVNPKRPALPNVTNLPITVTTWASPRGYTHSDKENVNTRQENSMGFPSTSNSFVSPSSVLFHLKTDNSLQSRRNTYTVKNIPPPVRLSPDFFNDSLEANTPVKSNIAQRLEASAFNFTPVTLRTPEIARALNPSSPAEEFLKVNSTYEVENLNLGNCSRETYVKGNLSTETYVLGNVSSSTYVKEAEVVTHAATSSPLQVGNARSGQNLSQMFDKTLDDNVFATPEPGFSSAVHSNLSGNNAKKIIEANLWLTEQRRYLQSIQEEHFSSNASPRNPQGFKRKASPIVEISPPKRGNYEWDVKPKKAQKTWSKSGRCTPKRRTGTPITNFSSHSALQQSSVLHTTVTKTSAVTFNNPFILAATCSLDPFMTAQLYCDINWLEEQELCFKKWLNALLTPPTELGDGSDTRHPVDVTKLWQECKRREVAAAPTKEAVSSQYHTNNRLDSLRLAAARFFRTQEISEVLTKALLSIDTGKLSMRADRDLHLDLGLQAEIMTLFLSYNPLWLRIGLETIYNVIIPLNSNSDIMGLSQFLSQHFFKNTALLKKYKIVQNKKYGADIKKFMLRKFLTLVYFLDRAKTKKLIEHDPCLYCRNAPYKESRQILLKFASETLSAVGDITRSLRCLGYVVSHQQTAINEYDYAVINLGVDLRDGVRLTKVAEIVLSKVNLLKDMRVPAISRLQKIHNIKVAFTAFESEGFKFSQDIDPRDIVDGHREKTLSLLWQIIYKFEAPKFTRAVTTIQNWWRSLGVVLKRRKIREERMWEENAARKIQSWYKRMKTVYKLKTLIPLLKQLHGEVRAHRAATKIQSYYRMYVQKKKYEEIRTSVVTIQAYARRYLILRQKRQKIGAAIVIQKFVKGYLQRTKYLRLKSSVTVIQQKYLAHKLMKEQRKAYLELYSATIYVQNKFRAKKMFIEYQKLKVATIFIQRRFRANKAMELQRERFEEMKRATLRIQTWYRAKYQMKQYREKRAAAVIIQRRFRANLLMKKCKNEHQRLKKATLVIQRKYRAQIAMRNERIKYLNLKNAAVVIQTLWRARNCRYHYQQLKIAAVIVQRRFRANKLMEIDRKRFVEMRNAALTIQERYRAQKLMRYHKNRYGELRNACIFVQIRFRATQLMKLVRKDYEELCTATVIVQRRFRANLLMKETRKNYFQLRKAAVTIQRRFRANILMKTEVKRYQELRKAAICIQQKFRAKIIMQYIRNDHKILRNAVLIVQKKFRANLLMKRDRDEYLKMKRAALVIQRRFRAKILMRNQRENYEKLRRAAICIQSNWRGFLQRRNYQRLKTSTIKVQRRYRAHVLMKKQMSDYLQLRQAAVCVQRRYRAVQLMKFHKTNYDNLRIACVYIQRLFRANKLKELAQSEFKQLYFATVVIQRRFRAKLVMKQQRNEFLQLRKAAVVVQQHFRAQIMMKSERLKFVKLKNAAILIQATWRAKIQFSSYNNLKRITIKIQRQFRANILMKKDREYYLKLRIATKRIQAQFRANRLMKQQRNYYWKLKRACIYVQEHFRATKEMKLRSNEYKKLRTTVIMIQRKFRANQLMKRERKNYLELQKAAVCIQERFRAQILMKRQLEYFRRLKNAAILIQRAYRAKKTRKQYLILKKNVIIVQRSFRAKRAMKIERNSYSTLKQSTVCIQKYFRAYLEMRKHREHFLTVKMAVRVIEERYIAIKKMRREQQIYEHYLKSAKTIQKYFRAFKLMEKERDNFVRLRNASITIQRYYRSYMITKKQHYIYYTKIKCVKELIPYIRGYLVRQTHGALLKPEVLRERKMFKKQSKAATKIQAAWRGFKTRSLEDVEVREIRKRTKLANTNADPQKTLGSLRDQAIQMLVSDRATLSQIIKALQDLDFVTRRCKETCMKMSEILPEQIYIIVGATSRSLPDMKACIFAVSILINFCKYRVTFESTWYPEMIDNIFTIMKHWCDKESLLFSYLCTLIWLLAHKMEYKITITRLPNIKQNFEKIEDLTYRKYKMVEKTGFRGSAGAVFLNWENLPLPSTKPDWGLDFKDRPRTFTNSMHALKSLKAILNL